MFDAASMEWFNDVCSVAEQMHAMHMTGSQSCTESELMSAVMEGLQRCQLDAEQALSAAQDRHDQQRIRVVYEGIVQMQAVLTAP